MFYRSCLKRVIDIGGALILLTMSLPLLLLASIAIVASMGRPIFFRQLRIGQNGRSFKIIKFRTMANVDPCAAVQNDDVRITRLGRWVRSLSIDELPTLLNVLVGDMSMIGPRPLLEAYRDRYSSDEWRRHEVRPGLTGLAQVKGRNLLSWKEKFQYDLWYVEHHNLLLDLQIVGLTLFSLLNRRGISSPGHATMPEFLGSMEYHEPN